ncbi:MAG TPA: NfeD family protein [Pyrinomonadaceae bacterium]|jgi:membrane-bound ClpP family serine protease
MMSSAVVFVGLVLGSLLIAALYAASLSRHKKSGTGQLKLMHAVALVETTLQPEGSVLVAGELWRARSSAGLTVEHGERVRIVGASGHLLEVEPAPVTVPSIKEA